MNRKSAIAIYVEAMYQGTIHRFFFDTTVLFGYLVNSRKNTLRFLSAYAIAVVLSILTYI